MPAYIGNVVFPCPLAWIDKNVPRVMGSDTVARSGNVVMLRTEGITQAYLPARLVFQWIPFSGVKTLYEYWRSGGKFNADLEDTGETRIIRFAAINGVAGVMHQTGKDVLHTPWQGSDNDLYRGEINLIIIGTP